MNKQQLERYRKMKEEIAAQEKRLEKLRGKRLGEIVGDSVKDYRSGKGIPLKIQGIPVSDFMIIEEIEKLEEVIQDGLKVLVRETKDVEEFIQTIKEPDIRELIRCKYIDNMNWENVGRYNHMHPDVARKKVRDFLRKK